MSAGSVDRGSAEIMPTSRTLTIHFICTGNIYRSRLAEAYCASRSVPGLHVFSSGIGTAMNGVTIAPYAAQLLSQWSLEAFAAPSWQQTTSVLVQASDVLVFMEQEHYRFCEDWIDPIRQRFEIWDISDIGELDAARTKNEVEQTFAMIRQRTDVLLRTLYKQPR